MVDAQHGTESRDGVGSPFRRARNIVKTDDKLPAGRYPPSSRSMCAMLSVGPGQADRLTKWLDEARSSAWVGRSSDAQLEVETPLRDVSFFGYAAVTASGARAAVM